MNTTLYFVQDNRTLITVKVGEIALGCRLVQIDVRINDALVVKVGSLLFLGQLANTIQVSETGDRPTVWQTSDSRIIIICNKAVQRLEDIEEDAMLVD